QSLFPSHKKARESGSFFGWRCGPEENPGGSTSTRSVRRTDERELDWARRAEWRSREQSLFPSHCMARVSRDRDPFFGQQLLFWAKLLQDRRGGSGSAVGAET